MDKIKKDKILELRQKKFNAKKQIDDKKHSELVSVINDLKNTIDNGTKLSNSSVDIILNKLDEISSVKSEISKVREAIKEMPILSSVEISNISDITDSHKDFDATNIINSIKALTVAVKNQVTDSVSISNKKPDDFIPFRRVRQVNGKLVYDDDPLQVTVQGGGSSFLQSTSPYKDESGASVSVGLINGKIPVDTTISDPTSQTNQSLNLGYSENKLTTLTKTISGKMYQKTLSYTGADLTSVSEWVEL